jgi:hypothetical protein
MSEPIEFFFEDGAKHKGQLLWITEKDGKPSPIFRKKHETIRFQAADLLAWEHNKLLRKERTEWLKDPSPVLQNLEEMSNDWGNLREARTTHALPRCEAEESPLQVLP